MKRSRRQSRGYVLVVTLGALVLAATVMAAFARSAIDQTRAARSAADDLQRRWGMITCRIAILPHAEWILAFREAQLRQPVTAYRTSIRMGACAVAMIITDEQAKANVNAVLANSTSIDVEDRIRRALAECGVTAKLRLRPGPNPAATQPSPPVVTGWGQVTDASDPAKLLAITELLTCFGDGRINLSRASAPAIALAAPRLLQTDIRRLIETRSRILAGKTAAQIDPAGTSGLMVGSACHGLWIVSDDGRRVWYDLAVQDESNPKQPTVRCFSW